MNLRMGRFGRVLAPGYSWCLLCETPWRFVQEHTTWYVTRDGGGHGMFPLCQKCWRDLGTPILRWPYYEELLMQWGNRPEEEWEQVRVAVFAENTGVESRDHA